MRDDLTPRGNAARQIEDQTPDGIVSIFAFFFGQYPADGVLEFAERQPRIDIVSSVHPPLQQRTFINIVLVLNLTDDLLNNVLDRRKTVDSAIFIDHKRHMNAFKAHLQKQVKYPHAGRHKQYLPQEFPGIERLPSSHGRHHVLDVDHSEHIVEIPAIDGHPGVRFLGDQVQQVFPVDGHVDGNNIRTRHHHIGYGQCANGQHLVEHRPRNWIDLRFRLFVLFDQLFDRFTKVRVTIAADARTSE